jgi:Uma2 family endonuclease
MELHETPPSVLDAPYAGVARSTGLPRLENGDLLHAREFLRRYEAMPDLKKAELVEGTVVMGSPVSIHHAEPDGLVQLWLGSYAARTPGTRAAANVTLCLDADNVVQPDALLRRLPEAGGRCRPGDRGYLVGPPELVVEIAATSASIDLHAKLRTYRRHGVAEYLVWRSLESRLDWFLLDDEEYVPLAVDAEGLIASRVFPGLACRPAEMLGLEAPAVLRTLETRLALPAHAAFVRSLSTS